MNFSIDFTATTVLLSMVCLFIIMKKFFFSQLISPSFAYSRLSDLKMQTWRSQWANFPNILLRAALISFMIAFVDPHFLSPKIPPNHSKNNSAPSRPTEGLAIYLVLDRSGSMAESVQSQIDGQSQLISKMNLLKKMTQEFIIAHPSDLIGLVSFARVPRVLVPLTLDRDALLKQLNQIQVAKSPEEDGTAMGYAIYKTANLLSATRHFANELNQKEKPPYKIKSAIIIVVTDGFQDPSRLDEGNRLRTLELDDAAAFAKNENIRLYVVGIDPVLAKGQYAPQRRQLQTLTSQTGGRFYLVNDAQELKDIYRAIDKLEKGTISQPSQRHVHDAKSAYTRFSLYPFFLWAGICFLFLALILRSTLFRVVP